jgi:hypothetical protein
MSTYVVTQDGPLFQVRVDNVDGRVVGTFSNKLAAETFAEKQRAIAKSVATILPKDRPA